MLGFGFPHDCAVEEPGVLQAQSQVVTASAPETNPSFSARSAMRAINKSGQTARLRRFSPSLTVPSTGGTADIGRIDAFNSVATSNTVSAEQLRAAEVSSTV